MSVSSKFTYSDITTMREKYDMSNPIVAKIIKVKEERLKMLQELNKQLQEDLNDPDLLLLNDTKKKRRDSAVKKRKKSESDASLIPPRRSARLQNATAINYTEDKLKSQTAGEPIIRPPNNYGAVPGVEVGMHWETRMECSQYGVHRPTVAGIHGGANGAYSIALSGGYPEDIDEGDSFIYTGAGGRDLRGTVGKPKNLRIAPQTKDQQLEGTNLSLVRSIESKLPVRVIRGYKSPSIFAPETGYRYDGLYQVVEYWEDMGKTGHKIYRFKMQRIKDQAPAPWATYGIRPPRRLEGFGYDFLDDFKENIPPNSSVSDADLNDIINFDREIQICIEFFYRNSDAISISDMKEDSDEEEFHGWN